MGRPVSVALAAQKRVLLLQWSLAAIELVALLAQHGVADHGKDISQHGPLSVNSCSTSPSNTNICAHATDARRIKHVTHKAESALRITTSVFP